MTDHAREKEPLTAPTHEAAPSSAVGSALQALTLWADGSCGRLRLSRESAAALVARVQALEAERADLYAALKELVETLNDDLDPEPAAAWDAALAALAKAEGK